MNIKRALLLVASALLLSVSAAKADDIISGSGTWGDGTPTTTESAAGATWSFSFVISDPATDVFATGAGFETHQVSDFVYTLNGTPISVSLADAAFFTPDDFGLFDLDLSDGNTISFFGDQVFGGTPPPDMTFLAGNYPATVAMNGGDVTGSGTVTISPVTTTPEPATLLLLGFGFFGCVLLRIWKS